MSKPPPPNGQIVIAGDMADEQSRRERERHAIRRANHDARMWDNIAAELAAEWQRAQDRPVPPPRRPGEGEVPAERFGPADRRTGSERK